MQVREIMTKEVISVKEDTPVSELARLLFDQHLTGMPVTDETGHIIGIITEYDQKQKVAGKAYI